MFRFWVIMEPFERGIVLRLGLHVRTIGPGLHWVWPLHVETVIHDNVVTRTSTLNPQSLTTADGDTVVIGAVITSHIEDIEKAILGVEGVDHALMDACYGAVGEVVARSTWEELTSEKFSDEVTKVCRRQAKRYGVYIERVQLGDRAKCVAFRHHQSQHYSNSVN
jgi:regulator of protease activity HflC (stomatin/prohibitin superfamily)